MLWGLVTGAILSSRPFLSLSFFVMTLLAFVYAFVIANVIIRMLSAGKKDEINLEEDKRTRG